MKNEHTNDKKWPEMVLTQSFIKGHSFPISLYIIMIDTIFRKAYYRRKKIIYVHNFAIA